MTFLKCLNERNFNIEKINKVNMLSSVTDYVTRFKHDYWANLVKLCVKHTKSCLIEFMILFNDLACLVSYLTQIRKNCNILIIMNLSTLEKKDQCTTNVRISYSENDLCHNKHTSKFEMLWHTSHSWIFLICRRNHELSHEISDS